RVRVDVADLVLVARLTSKVRAVAIVDQRKDAAAHRDARLTLMTGLFPRRAVRVDLLSLLNVQRLTGLIVLERGALKIHSQLRRPHGCCRRAQTPPHSIRQPFRMWLQAEQPRWIGKHRSRVRLRKTLSVECLEKHFSVPTSHVGVGLALTRGVAKVAPAVD